MNKAFTLIEVLIYIALFSLLMGTGFVTAFQLIDGSSKLSSKAITEEEGNFVLRKISWVLTGLDASNPPAISGTSPCGEKLTVTKTNFGSNPIIIQRNTADDSVIEIKEGSASFLPLTTINIKTTCLNFDILPALGSAPMGVTATAKIDGQEFSITKYIRK